MFIKKVSDNHHQSGLALDSVKSYTNLTHDDISKSLWCYTTINYDHYFFCHGITSVSPGNSQCIK